MASANISIDGRSEHRPPESKASAAKEMRLRITSGGTKSVAVNTAPATVNVFRFRSTIPAIQREDGTHRKRHEGYQRTAYVNRKAEGGQQEQQHQAAESRPGGAEESVEGQIQTLSGRAMGRLGDRNGSNHLPALGRQLANTPRDERQQECCQRNDEKDAQHKASSAGRASSERTATSVSVSGSPKVSEKRF